MISFENQYWILNFIKVLFLGLCFFLVVSLIPHFLFGNYADLIYKWTRWIPDNLLFVFDIFLFFLGIGVYYIFKPKQFQLLQKSKLKISLFVLIFLFSISYYLVEKICFTFRYLYADYTFTEFGYKLEWSYYFSLFLSLVILLPILEELIFRKLMLNYFISELWYGIMFSSFMFSIYHIPVMSDPFNLFSHFFFGVFSCFIYLKFGLLYSILFHSFNNFFFFIRSYWLDEYNKIFAELSNSWKLPTIYVFAIIFFILFFKVLWNKNDFKKWIYNTEHLNHNS